jgi:curli biogenesis system outer membrane secretion channel CsgG
MSAHIRASCAADQPAAPRPLQIRLGARAIVLALAVLLAGCTDVPRAPLAGPDPSDPAARVPRVDDRSTVGSYKSQRPVEPGPWGEQNQRVAPQPKSGQ